MTEQTKEHSKDRIEVLQQELDQVQDQIETLEKALDAQPDYGLGEGDPAITRREVDRALLERLCERAETLQGIISGTRDDSYGVCEECGNPIHPDRLTVLPDTILCVSCAQADQSA